MEKPGVEVTKSQGKASYNKESAGKGKIIINIHRTSCSELVLQVNLFI